MQKQTVGVRLIGLSAALDVVLTLIFVVVGRVTHAEELTLAGTFATWWPFLVGLGVGWAAMTAWLRPASITRSGIGIWIITVGVGMSLRAITGQGIALSFIVVASIALAVFLLGWRAIAVPVGRVARRT